VQFLELRVERLARCKFVCFGDPIFQIKYDHIRTALVRPIDHV
jgi:hypothetical protein